ncbi:MAG: hypothetical protein RL607_2301 [Bacteroidota bacterium]|jgi:predicted dienelactone hydrolase
MRILLFLLTLISTTSVLAQPYAIGTTNLNVVDASRGNRNIPVQIAYPATTAGTNAAFINGTFPVIAFGHGFVMTYDAYQNITNMLVPQGYIVAYPTTEGSFSPSHSNFALDLLFVVSALREANLQSNSFFYQHIAPKAGIMGHSMGAGCTLLAASSSTGIQTICTLAAAETTPSAITASQNIGIPTLFIAGSNDCITPPSSNQIPMYNAVSTSNCKAYVQIDGGSHCQMANSNFNCNFGELTCTPAPTITRSEQHQKIETFIIPWMNAFLKDSCTDQNIVQQLLTSTAGTTNQSQCVSCSLSNTDFTNLNSASYSNPVDVEFHINLPSAAIELLEVHDLEGRRITSQKSSNTIAMDNLKTGYYLVSILNKLGEKITVKIFKK